MLKINKPRPKWLQITRKKVSQLVMLFTFMSLSHMNAVTINLPDAVIAGGIESALQKADFNTRVSSLQTLIQQRGMFAAALETQHGLFYAILELFNQRLQDTANRNFTISMFLTQVSGSALFNPIQTNPFDPSTKTDMRAPLNFLSGQIYSATTQFTPEQLIVMAGTTASVNATIKNQVAENAAIGLAAETPIDPGEKPASVEGYKWVLQNNQWVQIEVPKNPEVGIKHVWAAATESWNRVTVEKTVIQEGVRNEWNATQEAWTQVQISKHFPTEGKKNVWNPATESYDFVDVPLPEGKTRDDVDWDVANEQWIIKTVAEKPASIPGYRWVLQNNQWVQEVVYTTPEIGIKHVWNPASESWDRMTVEKQIFEGYKNQWNGLNETWNQIPVSKNPPQEGKKNVWNPATESYDFVDVPLPEGKTREDVDWDSVSERWLEKATAGTRPESVEGYKWQLSGTTWVPIPVSRPSIVGFKTAWDPATESWTQGAAVPLPAGKKQEDVYWDQANEAWRLHAQATVTQTVQASPQTTQTPAARTQSTDADLRAAVKRDIENAQRESRMTTALQLTLNILNNAANLRNFQNGTKNLFSRLLMRCFNKRAYNPQMVKDILEKAATSSLLAYNQKNFAKKKLIPIVYKELNIQPQKTEKKISTKKWQEKKWAQKRMKKYGKKKWKKLTAEKQQRFIKKWQESRKKQLKQKGAQTKKKVTKKKAAKKKTTKKQKKKTKKIKKQKKPKKKKKEKIQRRPVTRRIISR